MSPKAKSIPPPPPSDADVLRIAAEAGVDPRTVRRVLAGKGSSLARRAVLDACTILAVAKQ